MTVHIIHWNSTRHWLSTSDYVCRILPKLCLMCRLRSFLLWHSKCVVPCCQQVASVNWIIDEPIPCFIIPHTIIIKFRNNLCRNLSIVKTNSSLFVQPLFRSRLYISRTTQHHLYHHFENYFHHRNFHFRFYNNHYRNKYEFSITNLIYKYNITKSEVVSSSDGAVLLADEPPWAYRRERQSSEPRHF